MRNPSLILLLSLLCFRSEAAEWTRWRGPQQDGHSLERGLPHVWSAESVVWRTPLKGNGQSSPVTFGDRIFLTTALDDGRQRMVMCIERNSGRLLWERVVWEGEAEPTHKMNGWASATCATDGERVYAFFGQGGGLFCLTVDGEPVWNQPLGPFEGPWGTAACPVLVGDLVIQNGDSDADAFLAAFDKRTGEPVWRTPREDHRGWSTPVLIEHNGREELVLNGHTGVRAYDPRSGEELWFCEGFNGRGTPTVTPAGGLLHVVNGLSGDTYAVRPGGNGNVTATHRVWHTERKGRDLPSPIVVAETVIISGLRAAVFTGYEAASGRELWRLRIGDQVSASPVAWEGRAFFLTESGETIVVDPASEEKIVARNRIDSEPDEVFRASITPSEGQVFLRSDRMLYCIGRRRAAEAQ